MAVPLFGATISDHYESVGRKRTPCTVAQPHRGLPQRASQSPCGRLGKFRLIALDHFFVLSTGVEHSHCYM